MNIFNIFLFFTYLKFMFVHLDVIFEIINKHLLRVVAFPHYLLFESLMALYENDFSIAF